MKQSNKQAETKPSTSKNINMKVLTIKEMSERIRNWEVNSGESFTDYFMHDNVNQVAWSFFLLGKGFNTHANILIDKIGKEGTNCYIDQEDLFDIHGAESGVWDERLYDMNVAVWSEFLVSSNVYYDKVMEFFNDNQ